MLRWVRRAVLVIPLVVLIGAVVAVLTARPDLNSKRNDARASWAALRVPLDARYRVLKTAAANTANAGGPEATIARSINTELTRWTTSKNGSVAVQVQDANNLEAMARRLSTAVNASTRLRTHAAVLNAVNAFTATTAPTQAAAFNASARTYEDARTGFLRRPVAGLLGFDAIPTYDATTS